MQQGGLLDQVRILQAWRDKYEKFWDEQIGDPRDPDTKSRKSVVYNTWFRRQDGQLSSLFVPGFSTLSRSVQHGFFQAFMS